MALEAIGGKVQSEPLNRNFSYLDSRVTDAVNAVAAMDERVTAVQNDIIGVPVTRFGSDKTSAVIQAALDYAKSIGGARVLVPSGTYAITSILRIPSNTTLVGYGEVIFKRMAPINAMVMNDADGVTGGYDANSDILIENITIDANESQYQVNVTPIGFGHAKRINIRRVRVLNSYGWHCIELNAVKDAVIDGCYFKNLNAASGNEMVQLDLMLSSGVFPWFGPYDNTPCDNIIVQNSVFEDGVDGIGSHSANPGTRHNAVKIINCKFVNLSGKAVKPYNYNNCHVLESFFENCDFAIENTNYDVCYGFLARGNFIKNMATRGIHLKNGSYNSKIIENYVEGSGVHGITVDTSDDVEIASNTSKNNGQAGIWAYGCSNVRVRGNNSTGNDKSNTGIRYDIMVGVNPSQVGSKNIVSDNTCGKLQYGELSSSVVTNNNITQLLTYGTNTNVTVANNMINGVWTP